MGGKKGGNKGGGNKKQKDDQEFDAMLKELESKTKEAGKAKEEIAKKKAKHQPKHVPHSDVKADLAKQKGNAFDMAMQQRLQQQKMQELLRQLQMGGGLGGFGSPFLEAPKTEISSEVKSNKLFDVATVEMQGWRKEMEDAHFNDLEFAAGEKCGLFGVFDGHSGKKVAQEAAKDLPKLAKKYYDKSQVGTGDFFSQVYKELDVGMKSKAEGSGATAVVALVSESHVTCASVGDSRAVLCRGTTAVDLSEDHKPENDKEKARIEAAGGHVAQNRVNGELAMSRAIGDFRYKEVANKAADEQLVIAVPDMVSVERKPEDKFVVVACDGIFDVMSNQEVCDFVVENRASSKSLQDLGSKLLNHCLAPAGEQGRPIRGEGTDNMTCTIIELL